MKKNIVNATITVVITMILTIGIYSLEFNVRNNEDALIRSATEYIHASQRGSQVEPQFVASKTVGRQMIVVFEADIYDRFGGAVVFERGLTGFYRPIKAEYGSGPVIRHSTTSQNLGTNEAVYTAYYAVDCPPEIVAFQVTGTIYSEEDNGYVSDSTMIFDVTNPQFIELCRVQGFADLSLYDENGAELSQETYLTINQSCPNPSIESAELGFINILCALCLIAGGIIALVFLRGNQRSEGTPCEEATESSECSKPIGLIIRGLVLTSMTLNVLLLQYILPTIGIISLFWGFRSLRKENKWFYVVYLMASIKLLAQAVCLGLIMTPLHNIVDKVGFWGVFMSGFEVVQFLLFRSALRQVYQKAGKTSSRDPLFWLAIWMVLAICFAISPFAQSLIVSLVLFIGFIVIMHSLYRFGKEVNGLECRISDELDKMSSKLIVPGYLPACCLLMVVCGVLSNHLPLQSSEYSVPDHSETGAMLLELGFPEALLHEVSNEDVALLKDAIHIQNERDLLEFSLNKKLEVKTVYIECPNNSLYVLHYFQWMKGGAYWQDGIYISLESQTQELTNGVLLYEKDDIMYAAKFPRLKDEVVRIENWFSGVEERKQITGAVNYPYGTKNQRGYLLYHLQVPEDKYSESTIFNYGHRSLPIQIPYAETEKSMLIGKHDTLIGKHDMKQSYTTYDLQAYSDKYGKE